MAEIKVIINGALGKMGQAMFEGLSHEDDIRVVGAVDIKADRSSLSSARGTVPLASNLGSLLDVVEADVLLDFTTAAATMSAVHLAASRGINLVIGTTGLSDEDIAEIASLAEEHGIGVVVAPNFALGAVVMIYLSKIVAHYFDWAEIIELHHDRKLDAPSGTSLTTVRAMIEERGKDFKQPDQPRSISRGDLRGGVSLHSVRLPGIMAEQEIIFGAPGQTLRIRHDTIGRECYVPGVLLAMRRVVVTKGLILGLDKLLGLED